MAETGNQRNLIKFNVTSKVTDVLEKEGQKWSDLLDQYAKYHKSYKFPCFSPKNIVLCI